MIVDSLIWNSILRPIEVFLHDWWTADVGLLDLAAFLESLELLLVGSLVKSLTLWLSEDGVFLDLADS